MTYISVWLRLTSQVVLVVKNTSVNAGDMGDAGLISGLGRSFREGHGNPLQYSCLEHPHGQRTLVDYSPWGHTESDVTEATEYACMWLRLAMMFWKHPYQGL